MRRIWIYSLTILGIAGSAAAQNTLPLTLAEAQRLADCQ